MSHARPDAWELLLSRLSALLALREALLDETAAEWARFARNAGWSRTDLAALWEGLTEDLLRRYSHDPAKDGPTVRGDVLATMTAIRDRIARELP